MNEHPSRIILSCAEALLSACDIDELLVVKGLSEGGSLFKSTSASAAAYMATGHPAVLKYLESVVQKFPCGGLSRVLSNVLLSTLLVDNKVFDKRRECTFSDIVNIGFICFCLAN